MSIWTDPHYRSEPLIQVCKYISPIHRGHRNVLSLCNFTIGDYGHFDVPAPQGNLKANIEAGHARLTDFAYAIGRARNRSFEQRFLELPEPKFGINAVYKLFNHFWHGTLNLKAEFDKQEIKDFTCKLLKAYGPSCYASPLRWEKWSDNAFEHWNYPKNENCNPYKWMDLAEGVRHLKVSRGIKSYKRHCRTAESKRQPLPYLDSLAIFGEKKCNWKCYQYRNVTILEYQTKRVHESFLLLNKDLTRLQQLLESTGRVFEYFSMYADEVNMLSRTLTAAAEEIFLMLVDSFEKCDSFTANSICRSLDIAQFHYLALSAGSLASRSVEAQDKKAHNGVYDKVFPYDSLLRLLLKFKPREALELVSIRKVLPVPDFCIYSCMNSNYVMHSNPFEQVETDLPDVNLANFSLYQRWNMVRNYYERHSRCPGNISHSATYKEWHSTYPDMEPIKIPYKEIEDIDFKGTFHYRDYKFAEHELRKDKTMAPNRVPVELTAEDLQQYPVWQRNQIARFIMDPDIPSITQLREQILNDSEQFDYVHLTALKPEAKKEGGRMFYMANDAQRVLMSEKEANIADYLVHKPGNSSGISDIELARRMSEIAELSIEPVRKVFISFDLEKWSPQQNPKLKEMVYKEWSYAFGLPHIDKLLKVHKGSRLAFIKHNVHHEYKNPGQDMEGYDAKTNTALHIDVMSYAISVCRNLGMLEKGAKLLALIDDGGMSLEFDRKATDDEIWRCIETIEKVYNMVGLKISWDKTFVSESLFQYLNEVYYRGFKVTPGLKAFLRVGKLTDVPARTIVDDLDAIGGEIQGAIKAGTSYRLAYRAYILEVAKTVKRWSRYKARLTDKQLLCCMFPVALGGLGIRSLPQIVTNESVNPLSAAIGNVKAFVHYYPLNAPLVNELLNIKMRIQNPESFLRAPSSIRQEGLTLNLQRFAIKMREWITVHARNPYITSVIAVQKSNLVDIFSSRIQQTKAISAVGLKTMNDMQPKEAIDRVIGKLQRSSTAAEMIGHSNALRIAFANKFQAAQLLSSFGNSSSTSSLSFYHTS